MWIQRDALGGLLFFFLDGILYPHCAIGPYFPWSPGLITAASIVTPFFFLLIQRLEEPKVAKRQPLPSSMESLLCPLMDAFLVLILKPLGQHTLKSREWERNILLLKITWRNVRGATLIPVSWICMCAVLSHSVMADCLQPHGLQPIRLLCPWRFSRQEYWSGLHAFL